MDTTKINETKIITQVAQSLLDAGYSIRVFDGEDFATAKTTDLAVIMAEVFACEETYFYAYSAGKYVGMVWFIHYNGNEGCDVITDYSVVLEHVLEAAAALAEQLECPGDQNAPGA